MKHRIAGSALIGLGVVIAMLVALGAMAQSTGTCFVAAEGATPCSDTAITAMMSCDECLVLTFPSVTWRETPTSQCYTSVDQCAEPTAVALLGFRSPITPCNAKWTVPGVGFLGMIVAAAGLVVLKRQGRSA